MLKPKLMALALVAALGTTACASAVGQAEPNAPSPKQAPKASQTARASKVALHVTNNNFNDVDVYALVGGMYQRLTMVPGMDTANVQLPRDADLAQGVRLLVDPIGASSAYMTDEIVVTPGDEIHLTVASPLDLTNWSVS